MKRSVITHLLALMIGATVAVSVCVAIKPSHPFERITGSDGSSFWKTANFSYWKVPAGDYVVFLDEVEGALTKIHVFDPRNEMSISINCKEALSIVRTEYLSGSTDEIHPALFTHAATTIDSDADLVANVRAPFVNNPATSREWLDPESIVWSTTPPKSILQPQDNP